ncbi:MAG: hypothetical protein WA885_00050 [Phormidesmis sp.]
MTLKVHTVALTFLAISVVMPLKGIAAIASSPIKGTKQSNPPVIVPANPSTLPAPGASSPETPETPETPAGNDSSTSQPARGALPAPTPLVAPAADESLANYSDATLSLDYPTDWTVAMTDTGITLTNAIADEPSTDTTLIDTMVVRMAAPPGPVVNANIDSFIEEGSAVGRYRTVTIDGQEALVIWISERPNELPAAIATFIGYGDETIFLFSRYSPDNEGAEDDILRVHTSFTNLASVPSEEAIPEEAIPEKAILEKATEAF